MAERSSIDDILDAVEESILAVGVRRTTFADVARRAGLSRPTLYTHFPDVNAAIAALLTRELGALTASATAAVADDLPGRDRLVEILLRVVTELPVHPLFERILDVDPDLLLPYVVDRLGSSQRQGCSLIAGLLATGQAEGSIREGDVDTIALTLLLTIQSFVLSSRIIAREQDRGAVLAELRHHLDAALRPRDAVGHKERP